MSKKGRDRAGGPSRPSLGRVKLLDVPTFSTIRVVDFGSVDRIAGAPHSLDDVVTLWTERKGDENPFALPRAGMDRSGTVRRGPPMCARCRSYE
jgi:hypothetical protein